MKDINYKDIRELKTFEKYGDVFTQERYNPNTGMFPTSELTRKTLPRYHMRWLKGVGENCRKAKRF